MAITTAKCPSRKQPVQRPSWTTRWTDARSRTRCNTVEQEGVSTEEGAAELRRAVGTSPWLFTAAPRTAQRGHAGEGEVNPRHLALPTSILSCSDAATGGIDKHTTTTAKAKKGQTTARTTNNNGNMCILRDCCGSNKKDNEIVERTKNITINIIM